jgi:hypothetical protein
MQEPAKTPTWMQLTARIMTGLASLVVVVLIAIATYYVCRGYQAVGTLTKSQEIPVNPSSSLKP